MKLDYEYPILRRWRVTTAYDETPVIQISTNSRLPDLIFIYAERGGAKITFRNPKVVGVRIQQNEQPCRMYENNSIEKRTLLDCTRRNSHPRVDMTDLYNQYGGVLLSKADVGPLLTTQLDTTELRLKFYITLEKETGPAGAALNAQLLEETLTTVLFFYKDGSKLQGSNASSHFSESVIE